VHARLPARNLTELLALARAKPGELTYASSGQGGVMHLAGVLFAHQAGVDLLHVPYRGAGPAATDTASGQVAIVFSGLPPILPLTNDGPLRILALVAGQRSDAAPGVPTLAELGMPGVEMANAVGLVAPRGTPPEVVAYLNHAANHALADATLRATFLRNGAEPLGGTAVGYAAFARAERQRFAAALATAGIALE